MEVRSVPGEWWTHDAALVARLDEALAEVQRVPSSFVRAGKAVWRQPAGTLELDVELAFLVYDSIDGELEGVRGGPVGPGRGRNRDTATLRALTFTSSTQTIELEVGRRALRGQVVPPSCTEIEIEFQDGPTVGVTSDELGYFTVSLASAPNGSFRLRYRTSRGTEVVTSWITI
jgi:hypothetical protein